MKFFLLLTISLLTLFSCSNELEFNEHAFQVTKDNEFWKAAEFTATIDDNGFISIIGVLDEQSITLYLESSEPGVYELGTGINASNSSAWFTDESGAAFTTEYRGNGEVTIEKYDYNEQAFTGTFRFNAFSRDDEVVNFINGVFYQVPVVTKADILNEGELKASVDELELEADEITAIEHNGMVEVQGIGSDGSYIKLFIPETTSVGSYNLNEQSDSGTYAVYGYANGTTTIAQFGTLFINEHDIASGKIKGTFTFTTLLPNSVSVENGSFTTYY